MEDQVNICKICNKFRWKEIMRKSHKTVELRGTKQVLCQQSKKTFDVVQNPE